jgi:hypothetical protein
MDCGGYDILYKCAKCEYSFAMADDSWHFCPCCGQEIDWGVVVTANEEWRVRFLSVMDNAKSKASLLNELDCLNYTIEDGTRHQMKMTDATKRAIIKSNILYYLGNGWTKEALIEEGFFKEEDFNYVAK